MIFTETKLAGAFFIDIDPRADERGFFARVFCRHEFEAHGLKPPMAQVSLAYNRLRGTVRGLHVQIPPATETKLVRCTRGAAVDVIVDLRPESPTYLEHVAVDLTAENRRAIYVPERFAHGYQTLVDDTEASYQIGEGYSPSHERTLRFDDPRLGLPWPLPVTAISNKDRAAAPLAAWEEQLRREMAIAPFAGGVAGSS